MEWFCVQVVWKRDMKITVPYMESGKQQWRHNFFPWKARAAKRYKNSKEKKYLKNKFDVNRNLKFMIKKSDIHHKLSHHTAITPPPATLKGIQVHFPSLYPKCQHRTGRDSRNIYATLSLFSAISWYHMWHICYCQKLLEGSELVPE